MARDAWAGSTRRQRLPTDWPERRLAVLERDGWCCRLRFAPCVGAASDADHIKAGDDHRLENLQAVCEPCHRVKSSREGHEARLRLRRPPEPHPALD
jgi:5-methylcytosine-specific restriction endonuclease McrA